MDDDDELLALDERSESRSVSDRSLKCGFPLREVAIDASIALLCVCVGSRRSCHGELLVFL